MATWTAVSARARLRFLAIKRRFLPRDIYYDRTVVAGLFYVTSDERNEFENDEFRIARSVVPDTGASIKALTTSPSEVSTLFKALESNTVLTDIGGLSTRLDGPTVDFVTAALQPPDPTPDDPAYGTITLQKSAADTERLTVPEDLAAFLFGPTSATGPTRHLLMVTFETTVWNSVALSFYQTP